MAGFKTHVSFGAVVGLGFALIASIKDWTQSLIIAVVAFVLAVFGSFLPDMDSKSGLPFQIIFGGYGLISATVVTYFLYHQADVPQVAFFLAPVMAFVMTRFVAGFLFKRFTTHRGIFHSIPMMMVLFFFTLLIVRFLRMSAHDPLAADVERFVLAAAVAVGFFSHLLLDEIWATTFFVGNSSRDKHVREEVRVKKSFGTAIKFYTSSSKFASVAVYVVMFFFLALDMYFYDLLAVLRAL